MKHDPHLFRKPSGAYYAIFHDTDRHPARKWISLHTREAAVAEPKFDRLAALYTLGEFDPWTPLPDGEDAKPRSKTTLGEAAARFLDAQRDAERRPGTVQAYAGILRLLVRACGEDRPVLALGRAEVERVTKRPGANERTRQSYAVHLRAFAAWCVRERLLPADRLEAFKVRRAKSAPLPKVVRAADLAAVVAAIDGDHGGSRPLRETLRCAFETAYDTGLRRTELCNLDWSDLDLVRGAVRFRQQKNGKQSVLPLADVATARLRARWEAAGRPLAGYVFPNSKGARFRPVDLSRYFKHYARRAGLPEKATLHGLRHGYGTMLAEAGASEMVLMEALRHSSIEVSRTYVHFAGSRLAGFLNAAITAREAKG